MTALAVVEDFGLSLRPNSLAMTAADIPLDNQSRTASHLNDLSNFRHVLDGESLMMDSIVLDSSYSPSEKSKQPHCFRGARGVRGGRRIGLSPRTPRLRVTLSIFLIHGG